MRKHTILVPAVGFSLLALGCQTAGPIASDEPGVGAGIDPAKATTPAAASVASRTATLWVAGLACPF